MTTGIRIDLTLAEALHCVAVGTLRHYESVAMNLRHSAGFDPAKKNPLSLNIEGAFGEAAVAKALGVYFVGTVNTFKSPDVGRYQVRSSLNHDFKMIIRSKDSPNEIYIFATGHAPTMYVRGWIWGHEAKQNKYLESYGDRPDAWFVPVSDLHSIESIPK